MAHVFDMWATPFLLEVVIMKKAQATSIETACAVLLQYLLNTKPSVK